jgi:hypothetical protein
MTQSLADRIRLDVSEIRQNYPGISSDGDAFAVWSVEFLHQRSRDEAVECTQVRAADPGDGGIDGVVIDDGDGVVYLLQCKYADDPARSFDAAPLGELQNGLNQILSPIYAKKLGGDFAKQAAAVRAALAGNADLVLQVVVFGRATPTLERAVSVLGAEANDLNMQAELWDLTRLDRQWTERETVRDLSGVDVTFQTLGNVLQVPAVAVEGLSSYSVAVLDGRSLAQAARDHGARIVDLNVRYQLRKTKINDAIAETATTPSKQAQFLVLNNGLTVICDDVVSRANDSLTLRNPQIVNGAQTALTIGDNFDQIKAGAVGVLARIMVVDRSSATGPTLARQISEATNRQNPVSSADLKAHDPLQIRIEADLSKLPVRYYYERRRNSFASLSESERKQYHGVITKENLGQRYRAMIGEPAKSITAKSTIFDSTQQYGAIFDDVIPVEHYVLANELFNFYHGMLNKPKVSVRTELYNEFDEETRLLFMRARNQYAAHGTALAYELLVRKYRAVDTTRALRVALDAEATLDGNGTEAYVPLHRLVVMTLVKWALSTREAAAQNGETFSIKDSFEKVETFSVLRQEARATAQFFKAQTLDLLPE